MSRISVFGLGDVGTVTAACLAHRGNQVTGVDLAPPKVQALDAGRSPIVEAGLGELMEACHRSGLLPATPAAAPAVLNADIATSGVDRSRWDANLRPGRKVVDLVHLEKIRRPQASTSYEGVCW
jgi:UDP-glucose 6-dehydrogenase